MPEPKFADSSVPREDMRAGKEIQLDGRTYVVCALSLKQMKTFAEDIKKISQQGEAEGLDSLTTFDLALPIITRAMKRNYPELDEDKVAEIVDLQAFPDVFDAILGANGLLKGELLAQVAARQR